MGCNCGRKRKKPAPGAKPKPTDQKTQPQQGKTQSFALITSAGRTTFGSQLEAEAANQRQGGMGTVRPI